MNWFGCVANMQQEQSFIEVTHMQEKLII